jgi:hypothetical protein
MVKIKNEFVIIIRDIFSTRLGTTISIEAKLKDWKMACLQAQRYLCFSDYSYIAMPNNYIRNIEFRVLEESGIGILAVYDDKIVEVLSAQKSTSCNFILKYIVISKIIENCNHSNTRHLRKSIFSEYTVN